MKGAIMCRGERANRAATLVCLTATLAACTSPGTAVRLSVEYDEAWSLSELDVSANGRMARAPAEHELLVWVSDAWVGESITIEVFGLRAEERLAYGRVEVTPVLGAEVATTVLLTRLPCGEWCVEGATQCDGDAVIVCGSDADGCMEWSARVPCGPGAPFCSLGGCRPDCIDECAEGERRCAGPGGAQVCGEADSDTCLDWLPTDACADGQTCSNGQCRTTCTSECSSEELVECRSGGIVRCADRNLDGCLEWGPAEPCPSGESCQGGACRPIEACTDECTVSECRGTTLHRCGNYDLDPCLEPSPGMSCVPSDACMDGVCTLDGCASTPRVCNSPPSATCVDSSTLRTYAASGTCAGECSYAFTDTTCASGCEAGACVDGCAGVTCDTPPNECYQPTGTCESGACRYPLRAGSCDDGDACTTGDVCALAGDGVSAVCAGTAMTCTTPPGPTCMGSVLRTYAGPGTCAAGACSYPFTDTSCPEGCSGGACASSCAGVTCTTPPSVCYGATGTCTGGVCSYPYADGTTCDDGDPTTSGDVCVSGVCMGTGTGPTWVEIAVGSHHSCARRASGSVVCWGLNSYGQLGDGTTVDALVPTTVSGLSDAVQITAGRSHTCARRASGSVVCWGRNSGGQIGDGTYTERDTPTAVSGLSDAISVSAGNAHTCAVRASGTVACWGENVSGEVGDGTYTSRPAPAAVSGLSDAIALGVGGSHSCAIRASGSVSCWGFNGRGALGDGTMSNSPVPVSVTGITDAVWIEGGVFHTCAIHSTGSVSCWGENFSGQLGDGTTTRRLVPTAVSGLSGIAQMAGGYSHTCGQQVSGAALCWGSNVSGRLGDGTTTDRLTPTAVSGLLDAVDLDAGDLHSCALRASGVAVCWGGNNYGQLGDGTRGNRTTPTAVLLP